MQITESAFHSNQGLQRMDIGWVCVHESIFAAVVDKLEARYAFVCVCVCVCACIRVCVVLEILETKYSCCVRTLVCVSACSRGHVIAGSQAYVCACIRVPVRVCTCKRVSL